MDNTWSACRSIWLLICFKKGLALQTHLVCKGAGQMGVPWPCFPFLSYSPTAILANDHLMHTAPWFSQGEGRRSWWIGSHTSPLLQRVVKWLWFSPRTEAPKASGTQSHQVWEPRLQPHVNGSRRHSVLCLHLRSWHRVGGSRLIFKSAIWLEAFF